MKKQLHLFFGILVVMAIGLTQKANAQAPQGIPYQAVARDNAGNLIKNQPIALRFSIHDGTANGAVIFTETHSVTTDALGLFAVNIGGGTSTSSLADVNWGSGAKFTQVELDVTGGDNYTDMGTTQMMSVPYALYAANANVPGVPGPQGATGPQGPAGATGSVAPTNGYPFMPIQNATSTLTSGTKSYWYIVRLTRDTTINGIQLYLSLGSDTFRCGIYRGYVKTGVSGSITLVGQTTDTAMTIGLPYMSKPITAIAGQSLTFAAGEYMTIAFHSIGSTAVYYQSSPYAAGNTHLAYSSTANYVSAGFPTTLTQTSISAAIVNKVCFELY